MNKQQHNLQELSWQKPVSFDAISAELRTEYANIGEGHFM